MPAVPKPSEMFSDVASPAEVVDRFETYKAVLSASHAAAATGGTAFVPQQGIVKTGQADVINGAVDTLTKSLSPEALSGISDGLAAIRGVTADLAKDWTLTSPNSTGLVPYDLEAPAKLLVPRLTPLRNILPRTKGMGSARQFKRILGWSNSGTGGVADQSAFMNSDSISTSFGGLSLRRGAKITYASDSQSVSYVEQGLSDQVNWKAQFAGQGFQDIRQLSQTALLWATMGAEERGILYGRGTSGNGYSGTVSAPVISGSTATTGGSIAAGTYAVVVTAKTGFGETAVSNNPAVTTTGSTSTITVTVTGEPVGSLGVYNLYVSQAAGAVGTATFQTQFVGNTFTLTTAPTNTGAVNAGATNTSADAAAYDGFLTVLSGPSSGYFNRVNSTLSTSNPGAEWQAAFLSLYNSVKADPDHIWAAAGVVKELGDLLKTSSSSNYRLVLEGDGEGHFLGSSVNGVANQITTKMLDLRVHPWMPSGTSLIHSASLPVPDSEVSNTSEIVNVQDYMAVDWPVIQATYDCSTYLYGALVHYAPAWSGLITNIL